MANISILFPFKLHGKVPILQFLPGIGYTKISVSLATPIAEVLYLKYEITQLVKKLFTYMETEGLENPIN